MNTTTQLPPITTAPEKGDGENPTHIIGLKTRLPDIPGIYSPGNLSGASLLFHAIVSAFNRLGILKADNAAAAGPLNSAQMLFIVTDARAGLAAIKKVLADSGLEGAATLCMFHGGENIFLPAGPDHAGIGWGLSIDSLREQKAKDDQLAQALIKLARLAKQYTEQKLAELAKPEETKSSEPPLFES